MEGYFEEGGDGLSVNHTINKTLGYIGFGILFAVLVYLILKITGVVHSAGYEEVLIAVIVGQVFYNGYTYRAIQDTDSRLRKMES